LLRSDVQTLSIELPDQRIIRFELNEKTQYQGEDGSGKLDAFHMADFVHVEAEVDSRGFLLAHSVRFLRKPNQQEQGEVRQSPEAMQRSIGNLIQGQDIDSMQDDRRLNLVAKPSPIADGQRREDSARRVEFQIDSSADGDLIQRARKKVNEAFGNLPNLRAKQVTSLYHSTSRPIKWIPDNVVTAEIAYEEQRESYSDIHVDGKEPADAPIQGDSDYMRSLDKAWSTGDFETISHCVFSELDDSDFHKVSSERAVERDLAVYEFKGGRSSSCIGIKFKSEVAYPAYKGLMKVKPKTGEVVHVELEATDVPRSFALDRAERSIDFEMVRIGREQYLLPSTAYWFGCFRNSYSCFMNRVDFRDYRLFQADSTVRFGN